MELFSSRVLCTYFLRPVLFYPCLLLPAFMCHVPSAFTFSSIPNTCKTVSKRRASDGDGVHILDNAHDERVLETQQGVHVYVRGKE